jgi:hypothetical protein
MLKHVATWILFAGPVRPIPQLPPAVEVLAADPGTLLEKPIQQVHGVRFTHDPDVTIPSSIVFVHGIWGASLISDDLNGPGSTPRRHIRVRLCQRASGGVSETPSD